MIVMLDNVEVEEDKDMLFITYLDKKNIKQTGFIKGKVLEDFLKNHIGKKFQILKKKGDEIVTICLILGSI